jgi:hypothetical protein
VSLHDNLWFRGRPSDFCAAIHTPYRHCCRQDTRHSMVPPRKRMTDYQTLFEMQSSCHPSSRTQCENSSCKRAGGGLSLPPEPIASSSFHFAHVISSGEGLPRSILVGYCSELVDSPVETRWQPRLLSTVSRCVAPLKLGEELGQARSHAAKYNSPRNNVSWVDASRAHDISQLLYCAKLAPHEHDLDQRLPSALILVPIFEGD